MKKTILLLVGILTVCLFTGCGKTQNKTAADIKTDVHNNAEELIKENSELKQKNQQLESMNQGYASKIVDLVNENNKLKEKNTNYEHFDKYVMEDRLANLRKEVIALKKEFNSANKDSSLNNIFNPCSLELGDKVGNLTVKDISITDSEVVYFDGSFKVTGDLVNDEESNAALLLIEKKGKPLNMPYSFRQMEDSSIYFGIINSDDLIKQLGTEYKDGADFKINITAEFSGYNYIFKEETDMTSRAQFVKLISINK